jgi:hypothetical protein
VVIGVVPMTTGTTPLTTKTLPMTTEMLPLTSESAPLTTKTRSLTIRAPALTRETPPLTIRTPLLTGAAVKMFTTEAQRGERAWARGKGRRRQGIRDPASGIRRGGGAEWGVGEWWASNMRTATWSRTIAIGAEQRNPKAACTMLRNAVDHEDNFADSASSIST